MAVTVLYDSNYGSSQRYAQQLAQMLHTTAQRLADVDAAAVAATGEPIVVVSPNYAGQIAGAQWLQRHADLAVPRALCVVGMSKPAEAAAHDPARKALGAVADQVHRFYLPGALAWSKLSLLHRGALTTLSTMLKAKPGRSDAEQHIIDSVGHDSDAVDFAELEAVLDWVTTQSR
ncbi:flavodoxin domain-containing protein [Corynebacterium choanae]|uniref:Flavodoxin domain protein n=1 Tax=Corynebacterium choanae TaxID=1862358 RepID=A0A3G6J5Q2_9CORY|nr:flavodoxin domain-containing protein [Corynebacterium choanae]AZA13162.1 Flavodoxin domain protein [Corynebacterium choanae]